MMGGNDKVDFDTFEVYCNHLCRLRKLARTPITSIKAKTKKSILSEASKSEKISTVAFNLTNIEVEKKIP